MPETKLDAKVAERVRARVREIVEALPDGHVVSHDDHLSLEVRKKRFGWFLADHHGDGRVAIHCKATDDGRAELTAEMPEHVHVPSHVGHHGWIGLWLDLPDVDWTVVGDALAGAYRLTAPKRLVAQLDSETNE